MQDSATRNAPTGRIPDNATIDFVGDHIRRMVALCAGADNSRVSDDRLLDPGIRRAQRSAILSARIHLGCRNSLHRGNRFTREKKNELDTRQNRISFSILRRDVHRAGGTEAHNDQPADAGTDASFLYHGPLFRRHRSSALCRIARAGKSGLQR